MSHLYKRESWLKEFVLTSASGMVFGATTIVVGHPFDSVKTKMQAQANYLETPKFRKAVADVWKNEGLLGFWKGWLPPLVASSIFRSFMFSAFEVAYTQMGKMRQTKTWADKKFFYVCPWSYRTVAGGLAGGTARAMIETVSENMKVKRQTGQNWEWKGLYRGAGAQWVTTTGMFTSFMIMVGMARDYTNLMESKAGNFVVGAIAGTLCWYIVWPFEYVKNQIQAETTGVGNTIMERWKFAMQEAGGIRGLYRGFVPGTFCYVLRNGAAMLSMAIVNDMFFKMGWRKKE